MILRFAFATLMLAATLNPALAQTQPVAPLAPPTGNAQRGRTLFETTLRCYACHGFDGQTGSPRLVPQARTEEAFVAYVRKPRTEGMPKFADVPMQDLVDLYAYVRSIPVAAPPVESIPLLKDVLQRRASAQPPRTP